MSPSMISGAPIEGPSPDKIPYPYENQRNCKKSKNPIKAQRNYDENL